MLSQHFNKDVALELVSQNDLTIMLLLRRVCKEVKFER